MNLTPLSSAHAYLQLKLYRSSVPSSPTRSIHSMKEVKDHRAQCGKNSGLICLRQLCLEKFRLKCCLMSMWFFMNFEDKVLQIHLVISLYLIKKYTLLQHMPFPCGSWAPAFFFFFSILVSQQDSRTRLMTSENDTSCNPEPHPGYQSWPDTFQALASSTTSSMKENGSE